MEFQLVILLMMESIYSIVDKDISINVNVDRWMGIEGIMSPSLLMLLFGCCIARGELRGAALDVVEYKYIHKFN